MDPARYAQEVAIVVKTEMERAPFLFPDEKTPTRLERAQKWVLEGKVEDAGKGFYTVTGSQGKLYTLKDTECACDNATKGKSRYCYHAVSVELYKRVQRNLAPLVPSRPVGWPSTSEKPSSMPIETPVTQAQETAMHEPALPSIQAIIANLSKRLPPDCLGSKKVSGREMTFVPHYVVTALLDHYAVGWQNRIVRVEISDGVVRVFIRLGIPCAEGIVWRESTGESDDWETDPKQYGNPIANAEASALRRAAARFGVGRWLYDKDRQLDALAAHLSGAPLPARAGAPDDQKRQLVGLLRQLQADTSSKEACEKAVQRYAQLALSPEHYPAIIERLKAHLGTQAA